MPTVPINIAGFNIPPLPENDIWFANAAAWTAYWETAGLTAEIQVADNINYGVVKSASTTAYVPVPLIAADKVTVQVDVNGDGILENVDVPQNDTYLNLLASFTALKADYDILRASLVSAGLVTA